MLKKAPNISNYSFFDCFIFFFFILKRFLLSLTVMSSISFFNLKRFLTSLIMLFPIFFYLFQAMNFLFIFVAKKINSPFFFKKKSLLLKKIFENTIFKVIPVILSNTKIL